ncbi:hypothetical protein E1B28_007711 [Marasmius oreades]|uniref:Major facilitator superfamily (MFS) profile domain-containing protein n=1 Tax=Marasmius oreades TaxID=181124 RepID=A0A9P7S3X4_9AGAR|nr:uncharacterized protein E1B28_007711 [Marasmius oreades]KAG7094093.1 hypothetical protein E1B28_007711 [Marasmius oreades]
MSPPSALSSKQDTSIGSVEVKVVESAQELPVSPPPNGGIRAWCTVLGGFLLQFACGGYSVSFGVYQDFYVREFLTNSSPSAISWIGSVNTCLLIAGGVIAGRLYDRGYFYWLLYGGSFLTVFSLFMLSLAKPNHYYQVFLSHGVGAGLGVGMTYVPSIAITAQYFSTRRALAMTTIATGASIGSIVHPIMLNNTFKKLGFGNAVRASAGLVAGLLIIACCLMRTRTTVTKQGSGSSKSVLKGIAKDPAYIAATLGLMVLSIGFYFPLFYIQLDAVEHNLNQTFAFYSLVILNFANALGRIIPGFLANTLGIANMITASTLICSAVTFAMIGLHNEVGVVFIALIYGFVIGAIISLMGPLIVLLTSDISELGARMGIAYFFSGIAGLIGTPIAGALLTKDFIWWRPAVFSGATSLVGGAFYILMLVIMRRKKLRSEKLAHIQE